MHIKQILRGTAPLVYLEEKFLSDIFYSRLFLAPWTLLNIRENVFD